MRLRRWLLSCLVLACVVGVGNGAGVQMRSSSVGSVIALGLRSLWVYSSALASSIMSSW